MRIPPSALVLALLVSGCAGERDAMRKEVEALRQEVGRVRATNDTLVARIETLELARAERAPSAPAATHKDDDRPSLDIVRLAPEAEAKPETKSDPDEIVSPDEPRPVLRSTQGGAVIAHDVSPKITRKGTGR